MGREAIKSKLGPGSPQGGLEARFLLIEGRISVGQKTGLN